MVLEKMVLVAHRLVAGRRGFEAIVRAIVAGVKVRFVVPIRHIVRKVSARPVYRNAPRRSRSSSEVQPLSYNRGERENVRPSKN